MCGAGWVGGTSFQGRAHDDGEEKWQPANSPAVVGVDRPGRVHGAAPLPRGLLGLGGGRQVGPVRELGLALGRRVGEGRVGARVDTARLEGRVALARRPRGAPRIPAEKGKERRMGEERWGERRDGGRQRRWRSRKSVSKRCGARAAAVLRCCCCCCCCCRCPRDE